MTPAELDTLVRSTNLVDDVWVENFIRPPQRRCSRCGISSWTAEIEMEADGLCSECLRYERNEKQLARYFKTPADLVAVFEQNKVQRRSDFDCMLLYSGGKDSTYVLYQLLDMGLKVLTFTFDNGFISRQAIENIRAIAAECNVESVIVGHDSMKEVFRESLARFSTVCKGCFKALLDLSLLLADERGINLIVTGLSRGQIVEERLKRFYEGGVFDPQLIERQLDQGREAYHALERFSGLDGSQFRDATIFDRVKLIDFFRYSSASKSDIYETLRTRSQRWVQPSDTGFCSSNCMINDVGIAVHQKERGYSNYEVPTAWEVRLGHLRREEAQQELAGVSDQGNVEKILRHIGYKPRTVESSTELVAHYVLSPGSTAAAFERAVQQALPSTNATPKLMRARQIIRDANTPHAVRWEEPLGSRAGHSRTEAVSQAHPLAVEHAVLLADGLSRDLLWSTRSFRSARPLNRQTLSKALLQVMLHHKALRINVSRIGEVWSCSYAMPAALPLTFIDLSSQPAHLRPELIARASSRLAAKLRSAESTSLFNVLALAPDENGAACLTIFSNDLVLDDFSWPVLLGDLAVVYGDLEAGRRPQLAQPLGSSGLSVSAEGRVLVPQSDQPGAFRREKSLEGNFRWGDSILEPISTALAADIGPAGRNWWRVDPGRSLKGGEIEWSRVGPLARAYPLNGATADTAPRFCVAMLPLEAPDGCSELFPGGVDLGSLRAAGKASWLVLKQTLRGVTAFWREDPANAHDVALARAIEGSLTQDAVR